MPRLPPSRARCSRWAARGSRALDTCCLVNRFVPSGHIGSYDRQCVQRGSSPSPLPVPTATTAVPGTGCTITTPAPLHLSPGSISCSWFNLLFPSGHGPSLPRRTPMSCSAGCWSGCRRKCWAGEDSLGMGHPCHGVHPSACLACGSCTFVAASTLLVSHS
jgi:hypothetical protein